MSQVAKNLLRVILKRIRTSLRPEKSDDQVGFVAGKGTNNTLFSIGVLIGRALVVQKDVLYAS